MGEGYPKQRGPIDSILSYFHWAVQQPVTGSIFQCCVLYCEFIPGLFQSLMRPVVLHSHLILREVRLLIVSMHAFIRCAACPGRTRPSRGVFSCSFARRRNRAVVGRSCSSLAAFVVVVDHGQIYTVHRCCADVAII